MFEAARALGAGSVLDAASLHHETQDGWRQPRESAGLHRRICALKDRELERSDVVLVASTLAERSYRAGGVAPGRLSVIPLGVDLARFRPGPGASGGITLLFAGKLTEVKGVDLLLAAFSELRRGHPQARLRLAGQGRWPSGWPEGVEAFRADQRELAAAYQQADVLVLPSRLDGFGLVVAEALACGTPVIVSDRVGAKDLVVEGRNGWIVAGGDAAALAARLTWCAENVESIRRMRGACADSVHEASWEAYSHRLVAVVERILAEPLR